MSFDYLKKKRILLVDDEQELLNLVLSVLKENGFEQVQTAGSLEEAVSAAKTFDPEFAILDVMLPDGSGFDLLHRLFC